MVKFLVHQLEYKVPQILFGWLEVPPSLTFSCNENWVIKTLEEIVETATAFNTVVIYI